MHVQKKLFTGAESTPVTVRFRRDPPQEYIFTLGGDLIRVRRDDIFSSSCGVALECCFRRKAETAANDHERSLDFLEICR